MLYAPSRATVAPFTPGTFEKKEYSVKAQSAESKDGKNVKYATYAKTILDVSKHATLEQHADGRGWMPLFTALCCSHFTTTPALVAGGGGPVHVQGR
jgi:hypothetical protein